MVGIGFGIINVNFYETLGKSDQLEKKLEDLEDRIQDIEDKTEARQKENLKLFKEIQKSLGHYLTLFPKIVHI